MAIFFISQQFRTRHSRKPIVFSRIFKELILQLFPIFRRNTTDKKRSTPSSSVQSNSALESLLIRRSKAALLVRFAGRRFSGQPVALAETRHIDALPNGRVTRTPGRGGPARLPALSTRVNIHDRLDARGTGCRCTAGIVGRDDVIVRVGSQRYGDGPR